MINCFHSQPVPAINKWRASLKLLDKISEEMRLIWVVDPFHAPFGDNAAVISLS
jgi:hypothetical protein